MGGLAGGEFPNNAGELQFNVSGKPAKTAYILSKTAQKPPKTMRIVGIICPFLGVLMRISQQV